jgi:hypothetical protein
VGSDEAFLLSCIVIAAALALAYRILRGERPALPLLWRAARAL